MTSDELFSGIAVAGWKRTVESVNRLLSALSDEELLLEVTPQRNRVYYIVGHLAAHHDRLLAMLGIGERLHPELDKLFIENPDRTFPDELSPAEVRRALIEVNESLTRGIEAMTPLDWLNRHAAVSEEDFAKDPKRNRIAVLQSRTGHAMYHAGQIRLFIKPRP
jgi:DinB superfamily